MKEEAKPPDGGGDTGGSFVWEVLENLSTVQVRDLDPDAVLDALEECVRLERYVLARRVRLLAAFGAYRTNEPGRVSSRLPVLSSYAGDEVAPILDAAPLAAANELSSAVCAASCLPNTLHALESGVLSGRRYREIVTRARGLPAPLARELDAVVAGWNPGVLFQSFRSRLGRWVHAHDVDRIEDHQRIIARDRRVEFTPDDDGAASLWAYGPADQLRALFNRLDTAARDRDRGSDDSRTLAQARFDALTGADIHQTDPDGSPGVVVDPARCGLRVMVPVFTLLGWNDPGELEGYGPIPASMARRLAGHAPTWTRMLTDPITSRLIAADPRKYHPSTAVREHVMARDGTCRYPGCGKPATACEIDHIIPFPGGSTTVDNLQCLCKHHHQAKTTGIITTNRHDTDED